MYNYDSSGYSEVTTYPSGQIRSYRAANSEEFFLGGVLFLSAEDSVIELYESGAVRALVLAQEVRVLHNGRMAMLRKADRVEFTEDGRPLM